MLRINEDVGHSIGLWTDGCLTRRQLSGVCRDVKRRIAESGRLGLLVRIRTTEAWTSSTLSSILHISRAVGAGLVKLALVGQKCRDCTQEMLDSLRSNAAFFEPERLGEAWQWLSSSVADLDLNPEK